MSRRPAGETPQPFENTLRSLRAERSRRVPFVLLGVAGLLGAWFWWFLRAEVPVFATTDDARLEAGGSSYGVSAPIDGVLAAVHVSVGQSVEAGAPLVELEAGVERAALREAAAEMRSAASQLEVRRSERSELLAALEKAREVAALQIREAEARRRGASAAAEAAESEARRAVELHADGLVSDQDLERARAEAERRRAEAEELTLAEERVRAEWERDHRDRLSDLAVVEREIAEIEGRVESSAAAVERSREAVRRHELESPVSGTVVEVIRRGPGSLVEAGEPLVAVIPDDRVRAVARFLPSAALGRIEPGQAAEIRLAGFPWTEFGVLEAEVQSVAGDLRDGKVVVLLELASQPNRRIPIRHGLPGTVAIRVQEVSPAELLFRSLGRSLTTAPAAPAR